ncbi:MAG: type I DNA topoisomerase [Clostridia bacterium]|nr:type I DNA topoisomerase [Clostridia bacterium]
MEKRTSNLLIVESPAKAKTIKKYLGSSYKVMASMGHVRDLPKSKLGIDVEKDFEPSYIAIRGKGELIKGLKKEAKSAKKVFLATDPDREGEAISWHLSQLLGLDGSQPIRVTFNEITKQAVQNGVKNPRPLNMDLVDAQQARRIVDRLLGYKISPFLWKKVRKGLSAGRVQSVATRLIVDREEEITAFVPEEYWTIEAQLLTPEEKLFTARFHGKDEKKMPLPDQETTAAVLADLNRADYRVASVKKSKKKRNPAPPFTTSTLQQEASRKLGFTSKRTMSVAQELYEGVEIQGQGLVGIITYMRTDSLRISEEALHEVRGFIAEHFGDDYCPKKPRFYKSRGGAQDAHETIRPTSMALPPERVKESLPRDHFRLYKLIWDRFVACQMESQVLDVVAVDVAADADDAHYLLKASGHTVVFPGFTAVYEESTDEKEEEEGKLPELKEAQPLTLDGISGDQHFTQPPPRFTEASLIKTLEENGIGRPSTYAPTITTILTREYVVKEGKSFKPTPLGAVTTALMKNHFEDVVNVEFTANMEDSLDKVAGGEMPWPQAIRDFYTSFESELKKAEEELGDTEYRVPDEETDEICEKCGRRMVIKTGRFGKFMACPGYPECKNAKPLIHDTGAKCPKCGGRIVMRVSKNKNKYYVCEHNPATCQFITWYEPSGELCKLCGSALLQYGRYGKKTLICCNDQCEASKLPEAPAEREEAEAPPAKKQTRTRKSTTPAKKPSTRGKAAAALAPAAEQPAPTEVPDLPFDLDPPETKED